MRAAVLILAALLVSACAATPVGEKRWLVPIPASASANGPRAPMIVWISGDGGWGKMEREVTRRFEARGAPTLGVDSLRYFAEARDPEIAANEIAAHITAYAARWDRDRIVIAGFSFGANAGPFIIRALPLQVRQRVVLAAFLAPAQRADFRVGPASWMGLELGPSVGPAMAELRPTPILCIATNRAPDGVCPAPDRDGGVTSLQLGGGHALNNQYDAIVGLILDNARTPSH